MATELATIGYEAAKIDDFIATLLAAQIEVLIDVRDVAVSRRQGFSKTALSNALSENGIEYIHLRGLGDPKEGREAARRGDFDSFRQIFGAHMSTQPALSDLETAQRISEEQRACLMCYERDPSTCHRSIVAHKISEYNSCTIRPLGVREGIAGGRHGNGARKSSGFSESPTTRR